ncbi:MAG: phage tail protein [Acidobacteriaceae bacterium]|nr:phage tail protein [Acidobacteriaceae bacterium]
MNPYLGEIRIFSGNFAPKGWALCNGQLLSISSNTALFSIIGTFYGGNGTSTFALPNLQGRVAIHQGQGQGLSPYNVGQQGGFETITLNSQQLPRHNHNMNTFNGPGGNIHPANAILASTNTDKPYSTNNSDGSTLNASAISYAGNNLPHSNIQPYLCVTFIIATSGIYPPRN